MQSQFLHAGAFYSTAFEALTKKLGYFECFFDTFLIKKSPEFSLQNYQKSSQSKGAAV